LPFTARNQVSKGKNLVSDQSATLAPALRSGASAGVRNLKSKMA
jgi:hypothetical protein